MIYKTLYYHHLFILRKWSHRKHCGGDRTLQPSQAIPRRLQASSDLGGVPPRCGADPPQGAAWQRHREVLSRHADGEGEEHEAADSHWDINADDNHWVLHEQHDGQASGTGQVHHGAWVPHHDLGKGTINILITLSWKKWYWGMEKLHLFEHAWN